jgi:hypothetical protein
MLMLMMMMMRGRASRYQGLPPSRSRSRRGEALLMKTSYLDVSRD